MLRSPPLSSFSCDAGSRSSIFCDSLFYGLFVLTFAPLLGIRRKDAEEWVPPFWFLEHGQLHKGKLFSQGDGVYVGGHFDGRCCGPGGYMPHLSLLHAGVHFCCC